jgi:hypothetical protein
MEHESRNLNVDGLVVRCEAKIIGDHFRYFVDHWEFPFCSIDKPNENGVLVARTFGGATIELDEDFYHEDVVRWALKVIEEKDSAHFQTIVSRK